jgi:hypothetical protein
MKKCPFLKLGAMPASKLQGSQDIVIAIGNCIENECALYCDSDVLPDNGMCALTLLAKNSIL